MQVGLFVLDDRKVQAAREQFYGCFKKSGTTPRLTFEEYLELFANDCNTLRSIADITDTADVAVRQLYRRHFRSLLPRRDGVARRRICSVKRWHVAAKELPKNVTAMRVAKAALAAGCEVKQVFVQFRVHKGYTTPNFNGFRKLVLRVNGRICFISECRTRMRPNIQSQRYYTTSSSTVAELGRYDFLIVVQKVPGYRRRIFVIPVPDILKTRTGHYIRLRIPLTACVQKGRPPVLDFSVYENAWHLLRAQN